MSSTWALLRGSQPYFVLSLHSSCWTNDTCTRCSKVHQALAQIILYHTNLYTYLIYLNLKCYISGPLSLIMLHFALRYKMKFFSFSIVYKYYTVFAQHFQANFLWGIKHIKKNYYYNYYCYS